LSVSGAFIFFIFAGCPQVIADSVGQIFLQGAFNFRDIGGYRTTDGKFVSRGLLFRSDALSNLTVDDQAVLTALDPRQIFDFRTPLEFRAAPDRLPSQLQKRIIHLPSENGGTRLQKNEKQFIERLAAGDVASVDASYRDDYARMPFEARSWIRPWLIQLAANGRTPQIYHCAGGADRTGFATAVLMLLLGVSEDNVVENYEYRDKAIAKKNSEELSAYIEQVSGIDPPPSSKLWMLEKHSYILISLGEIKRRYGTIDRYSKDYLDIPKHVIATLRQSFLESARQDDPN